VGKRQDHKEKKIDPHGGDTKGGQSEQRGSFQRKSAHHLALPAIMELFMQKAAGRAISSSRQLPLQVICDERTITQTDRRAPRGALILSASRVKAGAFPWNEGLAREAAMLVSHILREKGREVLAIAPEATLGEAARVLTKHRIGALLVRMANGALWGILSERDIVRAIAEVGAAALHLPVESRMIKEVAVCEETDTIAEIMETMTRCRFRHMPVVEGNQVVGIVSIGDVVKTRIAEAMREAQALKEYIATG
jgi:CBS domain-containing protein